MAPNDGNDRLVRINELYGNLGDGFRQETEYGKFKALREQWRRRRVLAELQRLPEGYEFQGVDRSVIVLTPPNLIAIQAVDGTWYRRERDTTADGPASYDEAWYENYLYDHTLPAWFMTPEHMAMINDQREQDTLGLDYEPDREHIVPMNYLEARYPEPPQQLQSNENEPEYEALLSGEEIRRLARRFPATAVNADKRDYRVTVAPTGHIILRHRDEKVVKEDEQQARTRVVWVPEANQIASYLWETNALEEEGVEGIAPMIEFIRRDNVPVIDLVAASAANGIVDLESEPITAGRWEWLEERYDEPLARALHIHEGPEQVSRIIRNQGLRAGLLHTDPTKAQLVDRPRFVYYPTNAVVNPTGQPAGLGHWELLTARDEAEANSLFGGLSPSLTAEGNSVRRLAEIIAELRRREQQNAGPFNVGPIGPVTGDINLGWVSDEAEVAGPSRERSPRPARKKRNIGSTESGEPSRSESQSRSPKKSKGKRAQSDSSRAEAGPLTATPTIPAGGTDPNSGLEHAPLNDGDPNHDQTGDPDAHLYQTRMINGNKYTLDRSPAKVGSVQPHKLWIVDKKGNWNQWTSAGTADWQLNESIKKINKWRDQVCQRNGWPAKRQEARDVYTREQQKWVFDQCQGEKPKSPKKFTAEYNNRFSDNRTIAGVSSLADRMVKQYLESAKENPGNVVFKPGDERGANKKREANQRRLAEAREEQGEEEEQEEEERSPRRRSQRVARLRGQPDPQPDPMIVDEENEDAILPDAFEEAEES